MADEDASLINILSSEGAEYWVERDEEGCPSCGHDATWQVVHREGTEEVAESTSWEDKEFAEDLAEMLNIAFERGLEARINAGEDTRATEKG